ncbi:hypothetical protein [Streptomyces sp. NPDC049915]|uniref:hypothetical protein n=1 Tax=Streptomyces sp. NPDC049915 TaxID=3155510 RepID=UPI003424A695
MIVVVLPGCSHSQSSQPAQSSQPTHKIVKHTFYGYDPQDPSLNQREVLTWTSQDDNGPIDGTYSIQEQANGKGRWTPVGETKSFQGTQRGNEIDVPRGQLDDIAPLHGTLQQNGHRLHLDSDLGIETYDLYDSPAAAAAGRR